MNKFNKPKNRSNILSSIIASAVIFSACGSAVDSDSANTEVTPTVKVKFDHIPKTIYYKDGTAVFFVAAYGYGESEFVGIGATCIGELSGDLYLTNGFNGKRYTKDEYINLTVRPKASECVDGKITPPELQAKDASINTQTPGK